MALTYTAIATVTVGSGGAANMEFTSIPATYTDLCLKYSTRTTRGVYVEAVNLQFNSSGGTAYSDRLLYSDGASASSNSQSSAATIRVGVTSGDTATANTFGNGEIYIPNYAGSTNKSVSGDSVSENNSADAYMYVDAGLWSDTSAITSIKLTPATGTNFKQYSTATLYGIKNTV